MLKGSYADWKAVVLDAVATDALPSPELIHANEMLAAWEAHLRIGKVASFPVSMNVNITEVCNARCSFCAYVPERVQSMRIGLDQISRADWLKFVKTFSPNGGGLGEPFAHPQIDEILEAVRRIAPYIRISIISNGSLIRQRTLEAIVGFVDVLKISFNATRKETYEATMAPLKWDNTITNLARLHQAKLDLSTNLPRVRLGYVLHRHNLDEVVELPRIARRLGSTEVFVNAMSPPPRSASRRLMDANDTIYRVPEKAARVLAELERNCREEDVAICHALPSVGWFRPGQQDLNYLEWPDIAAAMQRLDYIKGPSRDDRNGIRFSTPETIG